MNRQRKAKIVATIGPASATPDIIEALFHAGADVFRLNFSHGTHADHQARLEMIRQLESRTGRPIGVLLDLQGPKLRIGTFAQGPVTLEAGATFRLDLDRSRPGEKQRVSLPHREIFAALTEGTQLLIDDGRVRLEVRKCGSDFAETTVVVGGTLSDRKGVNVPDVVLPLSALTEKDLQDLEFGLSLGVDWVALSFVQRVEDIEEIKQIVDGRASVMAKLEKPSAINQLDAIVAAADAVMVARGDVVATQMLESMVTSPVPTRAEASDVAAAIYDAADAVMLSAESASGKFPVEAVKIMSGIIEQTESDPYYAEVTRASYSQANPASADAIGLAVRNAADLLGAAATVAYTSSGYSAMRVARERPGAQIIGMTPKLATARALALVWESGPSSRTTSRQWTRSQIMHVRPLCKRSSRRQAKPSSSRRACRSGRPARPTCFGSPR